jgi:hypothetical protein
MSTRTPEEIRRDIEHTREELAGTAAALAGKADVKARAHVKVEETKAKVKANPRPGILAAAGTGGVLAAWLVLRRR